MHISKARLHTLIDQLSDEELAEMKSVVADFYYDLCMLRAVHLSKATLKPGDTFTREEALQFLRHS
ncbi:hypothetical protein K9N68_05560 [Kovacikia minuta CCNUW1]|uniref:hypothetical protein n=1 Tax=Kovacikia minuta TaxID=2931930 RepID=UPI001CCF1859|nr:hypothetical protein [Kovacikia minuta]UBF27417.1 hypothetical protein K9N68_05560 [Kovacikia minuta CCNUW1]